MYAVEETHWWYRGLRRQLFRHWRRYMPGGGSSRLLDLGCGTGATLERLETHGWAAGLDIAPEALACCKDRGLCRLARGSVEALPFGDNVFDAVVTLDLIEHALVRDKAKAFAEAARVLRPGGLIFVNLPAFQWLLSSHDAAVCNDHRFTRAEIAGHLEDSGVEVLTASYWNTLLFPAAAAVRLLRKRDSGRASDLEETPGRIASAAFGVALRLETLLPRPFGLSVFAVGRKKTPQK